MTAYFDEVYFIPNKYLYRKTKNFEEPGKYVYIFDEFVYISLL